mgnify:CR=1 FL=1
MREQEQGFAGAEHAAQIAAGETVGHEAVDLDIIDRIEIGGDGRSHLDHRLGVAAIKAPAQTIIARQRQIGWSAHR